jgi:hypothetical protein
MKKFFTSLVRILKDNTSRGRKSSFFPKNLDVSNEDIPDNLVDISKQPHPWKVANFGE